MKKPPLNQLTDLHLLILSALWSLGESPIIGIHAQVNRKHPVVAKTIATLLARLVAPL